MATTAIGSWSGPAGPGTRCGPGAAPGAPASSVRRWRTRAAGVGWSYTRVVGRWRPVAAPSRLRISTPVSESRPSSLNVRAAGTASAPVWPSTVATWERTTSSRMRPRSSSSPAAASRRASAVPAVPPSSAAVAAAARMRRTSGTSCSRGRAREAVNARKNRSQSMSATVRQVSSSATARSIAVRASSGSMASRPCRASRPPTPVRAAMPAPAQGPKATEVAASPSARRSSARASRKALPGA